MPIYVVQKVSDALNDAGLPIKDSRLLLLGMAYKPDVHDTRESPSLEVMRQLLAARRRRRATAIPWSTSSSSTVCGTAASSGRRNACARPTAS